MDTNTRNVKAEGGLVHLQHVDGHGQPLTPFTACMKRTFNLRAKPTTETVNCPRCLEGGAA